MWLNIEPGRAFVNRLVEQFSGARFQDVVEDQSALLAQSQTVGVEGP
jgi:hypothetical protein